MTAPDIFAPDPRLDALLNPSSVAVIGASADPSRIGGRPIAAMLARGFHGRILPVNPNRPEIQGLPAFASVADLPEVPDVAIIAVPADSAIDTVAALAARGTKAAIVFTAGFAEIGGDGVAAQARLLEAAAGMRLLGPNCLGLFNARIGFFATFSSSLEGGDPLPGRVAIISQSGAYGTHVFAVARNTGIGTPLCITTGNEADVTVGELIGWAVRDPDTDIIAAYLEGIREAPSFVAALEAARLARKPVVVMKVGRSTLGQSAAQSHTASIAGDDAVTDAVLAELGAVRARTTEEMLDIVRLATRRIYPAGNTLGVITASGGAGVLISDAAETLGLPMPPMPPAAQARLKALLPLSAPANPVDCTAQIFNDFSLVGAFGEAIVAEGGYRSVLAFFTIIGGAASIAPQLRPELSRLRQRYPDRLYVLCVVARPELIADYEADGWTVFEDPTRAMAAIAAMGRFGDAFARPAATSPSASPLVDLPQAAPDEAETKRLLARAGIAAVPEAVCHSADNVAAAAESFGFPVVLKILSPDILHKSEIGGVLVGIGDPQAARAGYATLLSRAAANAPNARITGVLVARQMSGVECILGVHRDPVFGPVAMFGLGGIFTEVLSDVVLRRCPVGVVEAETMIHAIRAAPVLLGARGRPPVDVAALARMLSKLSIFAAQAGPRLRSVELNPVFARPDGALAADAVLELDP